MPDSDITYPRGSFGGRIQPPPANKLTVPDNPEDKAKDDGVPAARKQDLRQAAASVRKRIDALRASAEREFAKNPPRLLPTDLSVRGISARGTFYNPSTGEDERGMVQAYLRQAPTGSGDWADLLVMWEGVLWRIAGDGHIELAPDDQAILSELERIKDCSRLLEELLARILGVSQPDRQRIAQTPTGIPAQNPPVPQHVPQPLPQQAPPIGHRFTHGGGFNHDFLAAITAAASTTPPEAVVNYILAGIIPTRQELAMAPLPQARDGVPGSQRIYPDTEAEYPLFRQNFDRLFNESEDVEWGLPEDDEPYDEPEPEPEFVVEYFALKGKVGATVTYSDGSRECYEFVVTELPVLGWRLMKCPPRDAIILIDEGQARALLRDAFNAAVLVWQQAQRDGKTNVINRSQSPFEFDAAFSRAAWVRGTGGGIKDGPPAFSPHSTATSFSAQSKALYADDLPPIPPLTASAMKTIWTSATTMATGRQGIHQQRPEHWVNLSADDREKLMAFAKRARQWLDSEMSSTQENEIPALRSQLRRLIEEKVGPEGLELLDQVLDAAGREADIGGATDRIAHSVVAGVRAALTTHTSSLVAAAAYNHSVKTAYPERVMASGFRLNRGFRHPQAGGAA